MKARTYDYTHPLVLHRTGDPARGEWAPRGKDKPHKRRRK